MHNIIQRFRESGTSLCVRVKAGKPYWMPVIFGPLDGTAITYRNATVMENHNMGSGILPENIVGDTIHRAIRRCRLKLYRSKKKPYLNMIQKRRRFLWAKAHLKWTVAKWKTVLWSDESKFEVFLENWDAMSSGLKRTRTTQVVISAQFRSLHL